MDIQYVGKTSQQLDIAPSASVTQRQLIFEFDERQEVISRLQACCHTTGLQVALLLWLQRQNEEVWLLDAWMPDYRQLKADFVTPLKAWKDEWGLASVATNTLEGMKDYRHPVRETVSAEVKGVAVTVKPFIPLQGLMKLERFMTAGKLRADVFPRFPRLLEQVKRYDDYQDCATSALLMALTEAHLRV